MSPGAIRSWHGMSNASRSRPPSFGIRVPERAGDHGRVAAGAVVGGGDELGLVAVGEHPLDRARVDVRAVGEDDQGRFRGRIERRETAAEARARALPPSPGRRRRGRPRGRASRRRGSRRPPRRSRPRRPARPGDLRERRGEGGAASGSRTGLLPPRRGRRPRSPCRLRLLHGGALDHDGLRRGSGRIARVTEGADAIDDGEAVRDLPDDRVVGRSGRRSER